MSIWSLITGFLPDVWPIIAAAAAALGAYIMGRSTGAAKVRQKNAESALKATTKGAEAARKGRAEATADLAKGKTPEQIVRENDNAWR